MIGYVRWYFRSEVQQAQQDRVEDERRVRQRESERR